MTKPNKLTYKQIEAYVGALENKYNHAINTLGKTITDYIEFKGDEEEFMSFLKGKYSKENTNDLQSMPEENKKEEKAKPKIHRI